MSYSFSLNIPGDPEPVLKKVGSAITSNGGTFQGDREKGSFSGQTPLGMIRGEYQCLPDNEISITITSKPFLVPYGMIESEIRQHFG